MRAVETNLAKSKEFTKKKIHEYLTFHMPQLKLSNKFKMQAVPVFPTNPPISSSVVVHFSTIKLESVEGELLS